MEVTGKFSVNPESVRIATVKRQGKKSTSGTVYVPLKWEGKEVIVMVMNKGEVEIGD